MAYYKIEGATFYFYSNSVSVPSNMRMHHYHNYYELYFLREGSCSYFIDDKSYDIKAGDLVLIPSGVIHKTKYDGVYTRKLINFSRHYIPKSAIPAVSSITYVYRNDNIVPEINEIFEKIEEECKKEDEHTPDALKSYTQLLFILIARNDNMADHSAPGNPFVESAIKYIQRNYANDITLSSIAKMQSVSPEHLSRSFKKETGFGFNEYVTLVRLQRAERLLSENPNISVSEVAYSCGFNDSNYFTNRFKRAYGMPPLRFRNYNNN